jgi:SAM-dependent methyltransferase
MPYAPSEYWRQLHRRDDLSAVGQSALPPGINAWLYRTLARNLGRFVDRHGVGRTTGLRAFDVGSGTGFWVGWWLARGVERVDGCDLVPEAVERLTERFGAAGGEFVVADIAVSGSLGDRTYDLVSCQNVLLHVTEDAAFVRALETIAGLVRPGGSLILTEPILLHDEYERPYDPEKHSRARRLARYREPLEAAGLRLRAVEAATVLGNNPIEAGSAASLRRFSRWWRFVASRSKRSPGSAAWLGRLIYHLDPMARRTGAAPSSKFALFERPVEGTVATPE